MTALTIVDRKVVASSLAGAIVPAHARPAFEDTETLLAQANAIHARAAAEATAIKKEAYAAGFAEGREQIRKEMTTELVGLHQRGHALLAEMESSVAELAVSIVQRLTPRLNVADVVAPMVSRAIIAAQAQRYLLVKVHPSATQAAREVLADLSLAHPAVKVADVVEDSSLDPLSCSVESEAGTVRASWTQQLEAIRAALDQAGSGNDPVVP